MNRTWGVAAMVLVGLVGCQDASEPVQDPLITLQSTPDDAAMELRDDWETVAVEYPNGGVVAGSTLYPVTADRESPAWQQALVEPALFLGQTVLLPITIFTAPASTVSQGVDFPHTDTAVLPLPPSEVQAPQPVPDRPGPAASISDVEPLETPESQAPRSAPREQPSPAVTPPSTTPPSTTPRSTTPAPTTAPAQRQAAPRVDTAPPAAREPAAREPAAREPAVRQPAAPARTPAPATRPSIEPRVVEPAPTTRPSLNK